MFKDGLLHYVAHSFILLPQNPKCWDYRHMYHKCLCVTYLFVKYFICTFYITYLLCMCKSKSVPLCVCV